MNINNRTLKLFKGDYIVCHNGNRGNLEDINCSVMRLNECGFISESHIRDIKSVNTRFIEDFDNIEYYSKEN